MALTKDKKQDVVDEVSTLLGQSKLTVAAYYQGTSVQALAQLRRAARDDGTVVRVIKNRLFKKALESSSHFQSLDLSKLEGQLIYAFNSHDELAPAQNLANFAKTNPQIHFWGGVSGDGQFLSAEDLQMLANLPSKAQLQAQLVDTIAAPLTGFINVLSGNLRTLINVLKARAEAVN